MAMLEQKRERLQLKMVMLNVKRLPTSSEQVVEAPFKLKAKMEQEKQQHIYDTIFYLTLSPPTGLVVCVIQ
jgi:hypothetical protein